MSVYFTGEKGWRYEFQINKQRYTGAGYKTKAEAKKGIIKHKERIKNPQPIVPEVIDITFLELVESRLDFVKAYGCQRHYRDYVYMARRWIKRWNNLLCNQITQDMIQQFIFERARDGTNQTGNKEIRFLRSLFNHGIEKKLVTENPVHGIKLLPVEKKRKYIPSKEDVLKVILAADPDIQDYLWAIKETLGRMSEINQLTWDDVDLEDKTVTLYTRKKKGGHRTPRKVPMTGKLHEILSRRFRQRDKTMSYVFCHTYWSSKTGEKNHGPFQDRSKIMRTLCKKAGVRYFRFHALRHFGASLMDHANVPKGSIQKILGHERRETTEIYLHSIGDAERDAIRIMEEASCSEEVSESKKAIGAENSVVPVDNSKTTHQTTHQKERGLR